ncbi:transglycosylase SLT domain-containing protein [Novosphingobium album (ex Liu et al. 2023)]|uniref:transglycosylase SLT domain-containing protein n=1 Tax=Novosphingobium album (ex Liu et al. 2023) TaxID=3031130 RepID=UPI003D16F6C9
MRAAIARAAQATGIDFQYLLAQAKLESSLNPTAKAPTSSAAGLYQFTKGTWLETLDRHGADHGLGWAGEAIDNGRVLDPAMRAQVMSLRYNADASALMAAELASDNRAQLATSLGREPDAAELYLGHFLGVGGATTFLSALASDPAQSAAALLPKAAAANHGIFFGANGAPRSVSGVMDLMRAKVSSAMEGGDAGAWAVADGGPDFATGAPSALPDYPMGPVAREFHAAQAAVPQVATRSMAETLQASFGAAGNAGMPAHVRDAYAKLSRFNL